MTGNKRGRPATSHAMVLKALTQYTWASERTGLVDAALDALYSERVMGKERSSADRTYVFSNAKYPYKGRQLPRDVVMALENDPQTHGILHITDSAFWTILCEPAETRAKATAQVKLCLRRLGLIRMSLLHEECWVALTRKLPVKERLIDVDQFDDMEVTARVRLQQVIAQHPDNLDIIALLAALYREACLTFEPNIAEWLGLQFWARLQDYLSQNGLRGMDGVLDDYAINRLIFGRSEQDSQKGFSPWSSHRLPGQSVGLLLPKEDRHVQGILKRQLGFSREI